ncbi:NAD(P)-dependent alcohol dehydrogenase [Actinosynnema sp. NPDC047251]|uniref:Alcohol dehydrogenase zinc-binding domain-containing protein n=1 Tax=Saccharothrix espanaensis (strain ATCC 51144 / DSM 44229 / JCM 9112 / NBRC 15066 / NRRL 15764) TaxID=1179773 RepID=K0K580_SACES|nr:NAD(P)-dependent alcohol dehydrogenase [Saccharothrix espanaensis]CCH31683.1 Alcohol dehydrogenase zinc-binding domain-containing protein [Saccharothrix espanaensis DSM 44229]
MKAATQGAYGGPDVLELTDLPTPTPGDGEVLVRVRAASLNYADWLFLTGTPYVLRLAAGVRRPRNPVRGTDLAGVVEAVGPGVTAHRPGDEVLGEGVGAFAEYAVAKVAKLVAKPAALTFEQAAALPMAGLTALHGLRAAQVKAGDRVLVNGAAGGVGSFAVQLARHQGCVVTAVCGGSDELLRSVGVDDVIDYRSRDFTREDSRYDVVFDNVANHSLTNLCRVLTRHGTLLPNSGRGGRWLGSLPRIVRGTVTSLLVSQRVKTFLSTANTADLAELVALAESGAVVPLVGRTYPLAQVADAFAHLGAGHARGKVVISG